MWIALTEATYFSSTLPEVADYFNVQYEFVNEETGDVTELTWKQLVEGTLTPENGYKLPRGPYFIGDSPAEGEPDNRIKTWFINIKIDTTDMMFNALKALETIPPWGFLLNESQMNEYTVSQWYVGALSETVAYVNKVDNAQGYKQGTLAWAQPVESNSESGKYAVPKHPSFQDSTMELIQGSLPIDWFPNLT